MKSETKKRRAVVTLVLGREAEQQYTIGEPFMRYYAEKTNADFIPLKRPALHLENFYMEKFQVASLLDSYERILFLDADILVHPLTPDLFDLVPASHFGVVYDNPNNSSTDISSRKLELNRAQNALGDVGWKHGYFNSGVMVFSRHHRKLFDNPEESEKIKTNYPDQTLLNYNIHRYHVPIFHLDSRFNGMGINGFWSFKINPYRPLAYSNNKLEAFIMHFANEGDKKVQMAKCAGLLQKQLVSLRSGGTPDALEHFSLAQRNVENPDAIHYRSNLKSHITVPLQNVTSKTHTIPIEVVGAILSKLSYARYENRNLNDLFRNVLIKIKGWSTLSSLQRLGCFSIGYVHLIKQLDVLNPAKVIMVGSNHPVLSDLLKSVPKNNPKIQNFSSLQNYLDQTEEVNVNFSLPADESTFYIWDLHGEEHRILRFISKQERRLSPSLIAVYDYIRPGSLATLRDAFGERHDITVLTDNENDVISSSQNGLLRWMLRRLHHIVYSDQIRFPSHWLWITPKQNDAS